MRRLHYESIGCPYCHGDDHATFASGFELGSFRFYRHFEGFEKVNYVMCRNCRLIFANPRLRYTDSTLNDLFPEHVTNRQRETFPRRRKKRQLKRARVRNVAELLGRRRGSFLEIGCGFGDAMKAGQEMGFEVVGTELYQGYIEYCRGRGLDVRAGSVDIIPFDTNAFDVVYMEDVLEHLKNPFTFMTEATQVLRFEGILFIHTWAIGNPTNVISAFGTDWRENYNLDLTAHTTIFPRDLLKKSLVERGFEVQRADLVSQLSNPPEPVSTDSHYQIWDLYCRKVRQ